MSILKEFRVTLETVTPLFLGGANPRGEPELRPPSFRGVLRYWLRAYLGGIYGNNVSAISSLEGQIFGSAASESGSASAVNVRISHKRLNYSPFERTRMGQGEEPPGKDYLYWSMAESGRPERNNYQPAKRFIQPGEQFEISLGSRSLSNSELLRHAMHSFWLAINLGGLGSRSHRTAGSLSVRAPLSIDGLNYHINTAPRQEIAAQIQNALQIIRSGEKHDKTSALDNSFSEFDTLHPQTCQIWVLGVWDNPSVAINAIGKRLRDFRNRREPDHRNVAGWLDNDIPPHTVERAVFGLPIPYRYTPRRGEQALSGTIQGRIRNTAIDRRSSPLWLKITKLHPKGYAGFATLFHSRFLPKDEKLHAKKHGANLQPVEPPEDYTLIQEWIAEQFPNNEAVNYD